MGVLTVCIPTIPGRESVLSRLLWTLAPQNVNVIVAGGSGPMGDKLNACFQAAITSHVVAVDDDDLITPDYADWLPPTDVDFVGYRIVWLEDGRYMGSVAHRGDGDPGWSGMDRGVSPKCPVATDLARSVAFGNDYTADRDWSAKVQAGVSSHLFIDRHMYFYDHWDRHMAGTAREHGLTGRPQRDVGVWPYDRDRFTWL